MKSIKILLIFLIALTLSNPALSFAEVKKEYYPSGKLKKESNFVNGKKEGISKFYYESGKLSGECNYENGKLEGIAKTYFESGQLLGEGNYKNEKLEGIGKGYYESGQLKQEVNFVNDKQEGINKGYYESGGIEFIDTYKNGQRINRKKYDKNGKEEDFEGKFLRHIPLFVSQINKLKIDNKILTLKLDFSATDLKSAQSLGANYAPDKVHINTSEWGIYHYQIILDFTIKLNETKPKQWLEQRFSEAWKNNCELNGWIFEFI